MATVDDVLTFARVQSQTDSNGLTDANGIVFINEALFDFNRRLVDAGIDASQVQESYNDFTANQGTYLYPTNMMFLKTIELNYTSTQPQDYITAQQIDIANLPQGVSFSWLRKNADKYNPQFDDRGDWFEVFPTPTASDNTTQAIRIFYYKKPTEYTTVNDTIEYPPSLDYRTFGWRISANYLKSLGKLNESIAAMSEYDIRVRQYIATLGRGSQQPLQANPIPWSGFEF